MRKNNEKNSFIVFCFCQYIFFDSRNCETLEQLGQDCHSLDEFNDKSLGNGYIIGALLAICNKLINGNVVTPSTIVAVSVSPIAFTFLKYQNDPAFKKNPYDPSFFAVASSWISFMGTSFIMNKAANLIL